MMHGPKKAQGSVAKQGGRDGKGKNLRVLGSCALLEKSEVQDTWRARVCYQGLLQTSGEDLLAAGNNTGHY